MIPKGILRWILLPVLVVLAFFITGIFSALIVDGSLYWAEIRAGVLCPVVVIGVTYVVAPNYKLGAITVAYVLGCLVALEYPGQSMFPESHPKAYQYTYIPLGITYLSGSISFVVFFAIGLVKKTRSKLG